MVHRISPSNKDPSIWGKIYWDFMFTLACNYPHVTPGGNNDIIITDTQFQKIKRRTECTLQFVTRCIPCPTCRLHFKAYMRRHPLRDNMGSREELIRWLYNAKGEVNARQNKRNATYRTICRYYNVQHNA